MSSAAYVYYIAQVVISQVMSHICKIEMIKSAFISCEAGPLVCYTPSAMGFRACQYQLMMYTITLLLGTH
jgi:hypothetical protein